MISLKRPNSLLGELWNATPEPRRPITGEPGPAYLRAALLSGARFATAARLRMHGTIRLGRWKEFQAEEVIHLRRGYVWKARVKGGISGFDALVDGIEALHWKALGIIPVANECGPDVRRSAIGRWLLESIWLPTMLLPEEGAVWKDSSVVLNRFGEQIRLTLECDQDGQLKCLWGPRWGNFGGGACRYIPFGCAVEERHDFEGYILPTRVRAGWNWGSSAQDEGEFFRATIDDVQLR